MKQSAEQFMSKFCSIEFGAKKSLCFSVADICLQGGHTI